MAYKISIRRSALKSLKKIPQPYYSRIKDAIFKLADEPRPSGSIKLKGRNGYRIRVGDYRVIYDIFDDELLIDIIKIGSRGSIY